LEPSDKELESAATHQSTAEDSKRGAKFSPILVQLNLFSEKTPAQQSLQQPDNLHDTQLFHRHNNCHTQDRGWKALEHRYSMAKNPVSELPF
jgi:3-keto-L-gulonate-6-phosphate decarboxylase